MATIRDIVFDCRHPASLARFWAAAIDEYEVAPYDQDEHDRLSLAGHDGPEDDPTVLVECEGAGPRLWFQLVAEPKVVKNRVHLDVCATGPVGEEEARLVGIGASVVHRGTEWVTMADPEGNEFCLFSSAHANERSGREGWRANIRSS